MIWGLRSDTLLCFRAGIDKINSCRNRVNQTLVNGPSRGILNEAYRSSVPRRNQHRLHATPAGRLQSLLGRLLNGIVGRNFLPP